METPANPTTEVSEVASNVIDRQIKIRRSSGEEGCASLCDTCTASTVFRRENSIQKHVYCTRVANYVPSDIQECSGFTNMKEMALWQMQAMALEINPEALRKAGFTRRDEK